MFTSLATFNQVPLGKVDTQNGKHVWVGKVISGRVIDEVGGENEVVEVGQVDGQTTDDGHDCEGCLVLRYGSVVRSVHHPGCELAAETSNKNE